MLSVGSVERYVLLHIRMRSALTGLEEMIREPVDMRNHLWKLRDEERDSARTAGVLGVNVAGHPYAM